MATGFGHVAQRVEDRTQRIIALRGILAAKRQIRHYKRPLFIRHIRLIARAVSIPHACIVSYREADRYANANKGIKLITDSSQKKEAEGLGTDLVIALDNEKEIAGLPELDAVADMVGHETIDRILPHIRKNGVLATVLGAPASTQGRDLRVVSVWAKPDSTRLEQLGREVAQGVFSIPIGKRLKLSQIGEAQKLAEKGGIGKIVLTP